MRKRAILALLLVVVLAMTASCKLIVKDAEVDRQTVIAEVAGQQIIKQDVETEVASVMNMQAYYYYQYGLNYDPADSKNIQAARNTAVENLILDIVLKQKEQEMGIALTDEEIAALQTELDTTYAGYVDTIRTSYFAESELTGEELDTAVMQMTEQMYGTKDALLESKKAEAVYQKLKDTVVADVAVTDEEVQNEYNAGVTTAMENYGTNLPAYGQAVRAGSTVYYVPAGYRYVKNLLVLLDEEDSTAISDLSTQLSDANTQLTSVNTAIAALPEDATTDTEDQAASREGLVTQKAELEAKVADLSAQLTQRQDAAYAKKQPIIDEVLAKFDAGSPDWGSFAPFGRLVEVPCVKRNAIAVTAAISAAELALSGVSSVIPFDETVDAMRRIGRTLPMELRETGLGGLATTPTAKKAVDRILTRFQKS